jgi:hypothetical protein
MTEVAKELEKESKSQIEKEVKKTLDKDFGENAEIEIKKELEALGKELPNNSNTLMMLKYIFADSHILKTFSKKPEEEHVDNQDLFKKISMTFKILKELIRNTVMKIKEDQYQQVIDSELKFPEDTERLSLVVGVFHKAFNDEITELLFKIVDFHHYQDFRSISEINYMLIPFVANDAIDVKSLTQDFEEFKLIVRDFACEVLNLNINFEPHLIE